MTVHQLNKALVRQRLEKTATTYAVHAVVQKEIAHRVLERLDYIKQTPTRLLDLSLHGSDGEAYLRKRFPKASYVAAMPFMAALRQRKAGWFQTLKSVCVPFDGLPFQTRSVDFIFMNLRLLWTPDWALLLRECRRVLMPQGMLLFTSLGPDTLFELRRAFIASNRLPAVHSFIDMHDIGDVLVGAGFENPVMDMEKLIMQYPSLKALTTDLRLTGAQYAQEDQPLGLMTPRAWQNISSHYKVNDAALYPATVEIIYGHAWANDALLQRKTKTGDVFVPVESLRGS